MPPWLTAVKLGNTVVSASPCSMSTGPPTFSRDGPVDKRCDQRAHVGAVAEEVARRDLAEGVGRRERRYAARERLRVQRTSATSEQAGDRERREKIQVHDWRPYDAFSNVPNVARFLEQAEGLKRC